jgi:hypothetical protein
MDPWKAVLVDGFTQSSKTWKCFDVMADKIGDSKGILVMFITQANSASSVQQVLQRAQNNPKLCQCIPKENMFKSSSIPYAPNLDGKNRMVVDYWHSNTKKNMMRLAVDGGSRVRDIIIAVDETEQGGEKGVKDRLEFVTEVERTVAIRVRLIFVTATVANLSKSIARIANRESIDCSKNKHSVVHDIVHGPPCVEHHFVNPNEGYVGPSWFSTAVDANGVNLWRRLCFPKRQKDMTNDAYQKMRYDCVYEAMDKLTTEQRELSLVVTSVKVEDHRIMVKGMFKLGYNVVVELNGTNEKNYLVHYDDGCGESNVWELPYSLIETLADNGNLETFRNSERKVVKSGITHRSHVTLPHMLQAALFMATGAEDRIKANTSPVEFIKLEALSMALSNTINKSRRRPEGYPEQQVQVAMIAGHLAGRGITIQNPFIDFTCTSFVFVDTKDKSQRGATNAQRFGRACGMMKEIFTMPGRAPVLIATEAIMKDALANEEALSDKAKKLDTGQLISIKDLVPKADWNKIVKKMNDSMIVSLVHDQTPSVCTDEYKGKKLTKQMQLLLEYYAISKSGISSFTLQDIANNEVCKKINATNNRGIHKYFVDNGIITKVAGCKSTFVMSENGNNMIKSVS